MQFNTLTDVLNYVPYGNYGDDAPAFSALHVFVVNNIENSSVCAIAITKMAVDWMGAENEIAIPEIIVIDYFFDYLNSVALTNYLSYKKDNNIAKIKEMYYLLPEFID